MRPSTVPLSDMLTSAARRRGARGFSFDELVDPAAYHGATFGELVEWMAKSQSDGTIEAVVADPADRAAGRRFRISARNTPNGGRSAPAVGRHTQ